MTAAVSIAWGEQILPWLIWAVTIAVGVAAVALVRLIYRGPSTTTRRSSGEARHPRQVRQ